MPNFSASSRDFRDDRIDALRTLAMVWMTVFHFCFDLNHLGLIFRQNFYADPFWTLQRTAIVSLFLGLAGFSQAVAWHSQGLAMRPWRQRWDARFWRRWGQIAACAGLVSLGSWLVFPKSFIYFGVLHGLAVMLLMGRLSASWGRALWGAGGLVFALFFISAYAIQSSDILQIFNEKYLNWLGFISRKPITEDYVPLLPWLGVFWWGMAAGHEVCTHHPHRLAGASNPPYLRYLAAPGRWSLSYYMLHQPVLLGCLSVWMYVARP